MVKLTSSFTMQRVIFPAASKVQKAEQARPCAGGHEILGPKMSVIGRRAEEVADMAVSHYGLPYTL